MNAQDKTPLAIEVRQLIELRGPMPLSRYMSLCLTHPEHGYYMSRDPFGVTGDFTTSPEISQMFGELLGLWAGSAWEAMGRPAAVRLVELGPGRGTLLVDALRAAKVVPAFEQAISLHLVETSPVLRELQRLKLGQTETIGWYESVEDLPPEPALRSRARGHRLVCRACGCDPDGSTQTPGVDYRPVCDVVCGDALVLRMVS